jgi:hypothetical protein
MLLGRTKRTLAHLGLFGSVHSNAPEMSGKSPELCNSFRALDPCLGFDLAEEVLESGHDDLESDDFANHLMNHLDAIHFGGNQAGIGRSGEANGDAKVITGLAYSCPGETGSSSQHHHYLILGSTRLFDSNHWEYLSV